MNSRRLNFKVTFYDHLNSSFHVLWPINLQNESVFWCFQWYLIPSTPPGMGKQTLPHSSQLILIFMLQAVILSKLQSQLLMSNTLIFCPFLQLWEIILPPTPTLLDATVLCASLSHLNALVS